MCHPDKVLEVVVSTTAPHGINAINDAVNGRRRLSKLELVCIVAVGPLTVIAFGLASRIARG